jgi:exodeoxyribonuclease VII large subunit
MNISRSQFVFEETGYEAGERAINVGEYIRTLNTLLRPVEAVVQGEINRVTERGVGIYFTLRDKKENAVLNCVVWRNRLNSMGIDLKEGMEVKVAGYTEVYALYGKLSFMTQYIVPVGEGALKLASEKLKKELEQAGYFDLHRKRALSPHVQNIGLITSDGSAAQKDFLTHLGQHGYKIRFYDVRVEGIKSVENIVQAIRWFNEHTSDTEVLVLTRGGGSLESLQAFNTLEVARAIYSSKIPVLAAIGHEQDMTVADLVAW